VGLTKLSQLLEYHYLDIDQNFVNLQSTGALAGELEYMQENMQYYLDQDKLFINRQELPLHVKSCQINFNDNDYRQPVAKFLIESEDYSLKRGVNTILLIALEERVDYPCLAQWKFPGTVLKVISTMKVKIKGQCVFLEATTGKKVGGNEEFKFMNN
jgi:hypothetical protein